MENRIIFGKSIGKWLNEYPLLSEIIETKDVFWLNPSYGSLEKAMEEIDLGEKDIKDAEDRLERFAPYISKVFPETQKTNGIIESPIVKFLNMRKK